MNNFLKTDKDISDFYGNDAIDYSKTRLDGIIYKDSNNKTYYQQNDMNLNIPKNSGNSRWMVITEEFKYRPDKISYAAYGNENLYWVILSHNNIIDGLELEIGKEIEIPDIREIDSRFNIRKEVTRYKKR